MVSLQLQEFQKVNFDLNLQPQSSFSRLYPISLPSSNKIFAVMISTQSLPLAPHQLSSQSDPTISTSSTSESVARALPDSVPENAPDHCPGTESDQAGKSDACQGCPNQSVCSTTPKGPDPDLPIIQQRMEKIRNKLLIMSGKGGVGKSTFTATLAWAFARDQKCQVSRREGGGVVGRRLDGD